MSILRGILFRGMRLLFVCKICYQPGAVSRQSDFAFRVNRHTSCDVPVDPGGFDFGEFGHLGNREGGGGFEGLIGSCALGH